MIATITILKITLKIKNISILHTDHDDFPDFRFVEDHEDVGGSLQNPSGAFDQFCSSRF